MNIPFTSHDNTCTYVKLNGGDWEFGVIEPQKNGANKHVKRGNAPTYEAALEANNMAARGQDRIKGAFA